MDFSSLGTPLQGATFLVVLVAFIRFVVPWRADEMRKLRDELKRCEADCAIAIKNLHLEVWGLRKQNIADQIALINVILNNVNAPELKALLLTLESVQVHLTTQQKLEIVRNGVEKEQQK
jgi:hypothetical protein